MSSPWHPAAGAPDQLDEVKDIITSDHLTWPVTRFRLRPVMP